jgi:hypothetical protein
MIVRASFQPCNGNMLPNHSALASLLVVRAGESSADAKPYIRQTREIPLPNLKAPHVA